MSNARMLSTSIVLSLALTACAKKGETPDPENANNASAAEESAPLARTSNPANWENSPAPEAFAVAPPAPAEATPAPAPAAAPLTDEQIVKITGTVDKGEIEQAKLAQKKAKNPRVKKFAAHMISQHSKSKKKGETLAKDNKLTVAESSVATDLEGKASEHLESLKNADAKDFDRTYTDAQVMQHQAVLDLLNSQLIPNASHPDLKAQLEEARGMVETHLVEAREIQTALLEPAASASDTPKSSKRGGMDASTSGAGNVRGGANTNEAPPGGMPMK